MLKDAKLRQGTLRALSGNFDEALQLYEETLQMDPYYSPAIWSRSFLRLLKGDYTFWADYSWLSDPKMSDPLLGWFKRRIDKPLWSGETGVRVFLYIDNGYGDFIQFIRYASKIEGCTVVAESPPGMVSLVKSCPGVDEVVEMGEGADYDVHCPLMLLPRYFGILNGEIFADVPYLRAVETPLSQLVSAGVNVGVVWKGNPKHRSDVFRSIEASSLEELAMDGVNIYSLQKDEFHPLFCNVGMVAQDWMDTASVVDKMDLVISVDTAVAHLAGAMGKTTWMMVPEMPDWRWLEAGESTAWYPTMRLFRKKSDWKEVIGRIRNELHRYRYEIPHIQ